jgi:hypothetical protein
MTISPQYKCAPDDIGSGVAQSVAGVFTSSAPGEYRLPSLETVFLLSFGSYLHLPGAEKSCNSGRLLSYVGCSLYKEPSNELKQPTAS